MGGQFDYLAGGLLNDTGLQIGMKVKYFPFFFGNSPRLLASKTPRIDADQMPLWSVTWRW
jgi:hypothetical protein